MYEHVLIRELPEWLRHLIRKQLAKRMSRHDVERLMDGNLEEIDKILGKKSYEELIPMEKARFLIRQFCWKEYKSQADFSDLSKISIAYTENDYCEPVEVYVDLIDFSVIVTVDHEIARIYSYPTLEELIDKELEVLDFNLLVSDGMDYRKE